MTESKKTILIVISTVLISGTIIGMAIHKVRKEKMNLVNDKDFQELMKKIDNAKK